MVLVWGCGDVGGGGAYLWAVFHVVVFSTVEAHDGHSLYPPLLVLA